MAVAGAFIKQMYSELVGPKISPLKFKKLQRVLAKSFLNVLGTDPLATTLIDSSRFARARHSSELSKLRSTFCGPATLRTARTCFSERVSR